MKAGELKKALENVPDDVDVTIGNWFDKAKTAAIETVKINFKKVTFFAIKSEED